MDTQREVPSGELNFDELKTRLQETYIKSTEYETRRKLLNTLVNEDLATRDIYSFLMNQAQNRLMDKRLDKKILKQAMGAKISDLKASHKQSEIDSKTLEKLLKRALNNKRQKFRRCIRSLKNKSKKIKHLMIKSYKKKIRHYRNTQKEQFMVSNAARKIFNPTLVPNKLKSYGNLSIFKTPNHLPAPVKPLGPFICDSKIKVSASEMLILQKDPKFSVRSITNHKDFQVEVEKMLAKHRYRDEDHSTFKKKRKKNSLFKVSLEDNLISSINEKGTGSIQKKKTRGERIAELWSENKEKYPYDPLNKSVSFAKVKPTDYKLNKYIHLPKPLDSEGEFFCELRRRKYMKTFEDYLSLVEKTQREKDTKSKREGEMNNKEPKLRDLGEKVTTNEKKLSRSNNKRGKIKLEDSNLNKKEKEGLESLKKRVKEGEIVVAQTDKSSRFTLLTRSQYLQSGLKHTEKDRKITWRDVKKLQRTTNNHVWWLSRILRYSEEKDQERMTKNIQDHGAEIPEMVLLFKDHKGWTEDSGKIVPSRPVVSGRNGLNTHLSEILSDILEPVALNMNSAEVSSTEETLSKISKLNTYIEEGNSLEDLNILDEIFLCDEASKTKAVLESLLNQNNPEGVLKNVSLCDEDSKTNAGLECLLHQKNSEGVLKNEQHIQGLKSDDSLLVSRDKDAYKDDFANDFNGTYILKPKSNPECIVTGDGVSFKQSGDKSPRSVSFKQLGDKSRRSVRNRREKSCDEINGKKEGGEKIDCDKMNDGENCTKNQRKITDFVVKEKDVPLKENKNWLLSMKGMFENSALRNDTDITKKIEDQVSSSIYWEDLHNLEKKEKKRFIHGSREIPSLQEFDKKPVIVGGDVEALYPSMKHIPTAKMMYKAIIETPIEFENIDFNVLNVYLFLVLGAEGMKKHDLKRLPMRRNDNSKARSLQSKSNREMTNWVLGEEFFSRDEKKIMLALAVQISTLLLMATSCYTFGGSIYQQRTGSGIGLRASACAAKILMGFWDKGWCEMQSKLGLIAQLFFRYIDDVRVYLAPIRKGWWWSCKGWIFDPDKQDNRNEEQRTKEELAKSFGDVFDFLNFTTESAEEFNDQFLPTLDVKVKVLDGGCVIFRHFSKPMINNIVLQNGTALSKGIVFSSLRQDLVRRLLNTSAGEDIQHRISVIDEFIQLLVNSNHRFQFIKSIVLQAITKYEYMLGRAGLDPEDEKYQPLYRERSYMEEERKILKYINPCTWYTGENLGEKFRQDWKRFIKRKHTRGNVRRNKHSANNVDNRKITTTMFVPSSGGGKLLSLLEEAEKDLSEETPWTVKLVEKSGIPLRNLFLPKFPLTDGCLLGDGCGACHGDGITCRPKGVVYKAECKSCPSDASGDKVYIGETSRVLRKRVEEHMASLCNLNPKSFQLNHWFEQHKDDLEPPVFKFKILGQYKDALTRQITEAVHILDAGSLNKKNEFRINELCRLESKKFQKDVEFERLELLREKEKESRDLDEFIKLLKTKRPKKTTAEPDSLIVTDSKIFFNCYRKRGLAASEVEGGVLCTKKRRKEMDSSTPLGWRKKTCDSPDGISGITPIRPITSSPDLVDPLLLESGGSSDIQVSDCGRTNMSNELRGSVMTPRKKETESAEEKSLFKETCMLERSSKMTKCMGEIVQDDMIEPLNENYFSGRKMGERRCSLDSLLRDLDINYCDWSTDSFSKSHKTEVEKFDSRVFIGGEADEEVLLAPATPGTPGGAKRPLSPHKMTPRGRPRKFSTSAMNSPILRKNLVSLIPDDVYKTPERGYSRGRGKADSHGTEKEGVDSRGRVESDFVSGSPSGGQPKTPQKQGDTILTSVPGHRELISCGRVKGGVVSRLKVSSQVRKIGDRAETFNAQEPRRRAFSTPGEKKKKPRKKEIVLDNKQLKISELLNKKETDM